MMNGLQPKDQILASGDSCRRSSDILLKCIKNTHQWGHRACMCVLVMMWYGVSVADDTVVIGAKDSEVSLLPTT